MALLTWDQVGEKVYETGVDHGVLYEPDVSGVYDSGVAWNGLISVTETPTGAESNPQYADNIKYVDIRSAEEFGATIEAFTYPPEFSKYNGEATPFAGVTLGQQGRSAFGMSYRTKIGNDLNPDAGYKLHLVYGATAAPSEKAYTTVNDSPEAAALSWELTTSPVPVTGHKPTAILTIDSTKVSPTALDALEELLYGTASTDPSLPTPDAVLALFDGTVVESGVPTAPTYDNTTDIITIPTVTGVEYLIDGVVVPAGAFGPITENTLVTARPAAGYSFPDGVDDDWLIVFS